MSQVRLVTDENLCNEGFVAKINLPQILEKEGLGENELYVKVCTINYRDDRKGINRDPAKLEVVLTNISNEYKEGRGDLSLYDRSTAAIYVGNLDKSADAKLPTDISPYGILTTFEFKMNKDSADIFSVLKFDTAKEYIDHVQEIEAGTINIVPIMTVLSQETMDVVQIHTFTYEEPSVTAFRELGGVLNLLLDVHAIDVESFPDIDDPVYVISREALASKGPNGDFSKVTAFHSNVRVKREGYTSLYISTSSKSRETVLPLGITNYYFTHEVVDGLHLLIGDKLH